MEIKFFDEQMNEVNKDTLDYSKGALHKLGEGRYMYKLFDAKQLAHLTIAKNKDLLADTDYQAIKYAEGALTEAEYAPIKAQRQAWRNEINQAEAIINS